MILVAIVIVCILILIFLKHTLSIILAKIIIHDNHSKNYSLVFNHISNRLFTII